ncbi:MAG: C10 family peptidase [Bacteroidaceae bacterium]|nr:C10 family peptidase [Bacteroidaceae bacterium]
MKKLFLFSFLLGSVLTSAKAQKVSVEDALQKASQLRQSSRRMSLGQSANKQPELVYTKEDKGSTLFYVFNYPNGGFAIIGGDENARELLGYSEQGAFNIDSIPEGMKDMLNAYSYQIVRAIEEPVVDRGTASVRRKAPTVRTTIADMITTKWDQGDPFNYNIPMVGPSDKFVTGCNATATAQVMKYYNYPKTGTGSYSYTVNYTYSGPVTFQANFGATTYNWANMLDKYEANGYTTTNKTAVATLMYHIGVGMEMKYNTSGSGGSGSGSTMAGYCLTNYFKYSKSAKMETRAYFTDQAWEDMIYNELSAGHPIVYSGQSTTGGHAFVVHGYNEARGGYAINWGWGGYCDGYFPLSGTGALQPGGSGTGGAGEKAAYVDSQSAFIGLVPDPEGDDPSIPQAALLYEIPFADGTYQKTIDRSKGQDGTVSLAKTGFTNIGYYDHSVSYGLMLENVNNGTRYYVTNGSYTQKSQAYNLSASKILSFSSNVLKYNGTYNIYPVVRTQTSTNDNDWQRVYYPTTYKMPQVTIVGGTNAPAAAIDFFISGSQVEIGRTLKISASKEYTGMCTYKTSNAGVATVDANGVVKGVSRGTATITVTGKATSYFKATSKSFTVSVKNTVLSDPDFSFSVTEMPVGTKANILHDTGYDGTITYSSSNTAVATVSTTGVVTARSEGWVTITAKAPMTQLFYGATSKYKIYVTKTSAPVGFGFSRMPFTDGDYFISPSNPYINLPLVNNSSAAVPGYVYYRIKIGTSNYTGYYGYSSMPAKSQGTAKWKVDSDVMALMKNGTKYVVEFFSDSNRTKPMNIPSISVTYYSTLSLANDVDADGKVSLDDLEAIKQSLLQKWAPGKRIADFNGDGRLSIKDIVDFLKK